MMFTAAPRVQRGVHSGGFWILSCHVLTAIIYISFSALFLQSASVTRAAPGSRVTVVPPPLPLMSFGPAINLGLATGQRSGSKSHPAAQSDRSQAEVVLVRAHSQKVRRGDKSRVLSRSRRAVSGGGGLGGLFYEGN